MKRHVRHLLAALVLVMLAGVLYAAPAQAAKKTVKKCGFVTETAKADKAATIVKKGTTDLTFKKGTGYIKFVAPSTKKYTFTFSKLKCGGYGYFTFVTAQTKSAADSKSLAFKDMKTKGGKDHFLYLSLNNYKASDADLAKKYIAKRSATVTLKKKQAIYFQLDNAPEKTTMRVVIK